MFATIAMQGVISTARPTGTKVPYTRDPKLASVVRDELNLNHEQGGVMKHFVCWPLGLGWFWLKAASVERGSNASLLKS